MFSALKASLAAALLLWQLAAPTATPDHLRFRRTLTPSPQGATTQLCATLDAQVFAHAAPDLKDLRLFSDTNAEIPYAATLSEPLQPETEEARILNLGSRNSRIVFDLQMPARPYTDVHLTLDRSNFLATAQVSGLAAPGAPATSLGSFTLFDLTRQQLSRSTSLPLPESSFPYLHVELELTPAPGTPSAPLSPSIVQGATVPPSREAQTLFTTTLESSTFLQHPRQTLLRLAVPVHVPVERITFVLPPSFHANFSRTVKIEAEADTHAPRPSNLDASNAQTQPESQFEAQPESLTATILRVHTTEANHEIAEETLSIPVSIGSNMQRPANLQITIDNGDDAPLPLTAVRLEMRQRRICFDPPSGSPSVTLYYGDPALQAPVYDYAKLFQLAATPATAALGPEQPNPGFHPRPETRPLTERHPELLWIVLLLVLAILAVVALRSARTLTR